MSTFLMLPSRKFVWLFFLVFFKQKLKVLLSQKSSGKFVPFCHERLGKTYNKSSGLHDNTSLCSVQILSEYCFFLSIMEITKKIVIALFWGWCTSDYSSDSTVSFIFCVSNNFVGISPLNLSFILWCADCMQKWFCTLTHIRTTTCWGNIQKWKSHLTTSNWPFLINKRT